METFIFRNSYGNICMTDYTGTLSGAYDLAKSYANENDQCVYLMQNDRIVLIVFPTYVDDIFRQTFELGGYLE